LRIQEQGPSQAEKQEKEFDSPMFLCSIEQNDDIVSGDQLQLPLQKIMYRAIRKWLFKSLPAGQLG
jgi:hypothetical protein